MPLAKSGKYFANPKMAANADASAAPPKPIMPPPESAPVDDAMGPKVEVSSSPNGGYQTVTDDGSGEPQIMDHPDMDSVSAQLNQTFGCGDEEGMEDESQMTSKPPKALDQTSVLG